MQFHTPWKLSGQLRSNTPRQSETWNEMKAKTTALLPLSVFALEMLPIKTWAKTCRGWLLPFGEQWVGISWRSRVLNLDKGGLAVKRSWQDPKSECFWDRYALINLYAFFRKEMDDTAFWEEIVWYGRRSIPSWYAARFTEWHCSYSGRNLLGLRTEKQKCFNTMQHQDKPSLENCTAVIFFWFPFLHSFLCRWKDKKVWKRNNRKHKVLLSDQHSAW